MKQNKIKVFISVIVIVVISITLGVGISYIYDKPNSIVNIETRPILGKHTYRNTNISSYEIYGIDVSHHQGRISWNKVIHPDTSKSIDFVFIRATVGTRKDNEFKRNWKNSSMFRKGAYHYYWSNINSTIQANNFINTVRLKEGDLPPVLDVEKLPTTQSKSDWRNGLKNWIKIVERHYGSKPILYTSDSFYTHHLKVDNYFKNYPRLWIANFNNVSNPSNKWHFWQYSESEKIKGINGLVDMNVFHGGTEELNELIVN